MELNTEKGYMVETKSSLFCEVQGLLQLIQGGVSAPVELKLSFPWTAPNSHISVLNDEGELVYFIESLTELGEQDRNLVEQTLNRSSFVFDIQKVIEVKEEFELRHWKVETLQGERSFQTGQEDWPRKLPDNSYLVADVSGDLYRIDGEKVDTSMIDSLLK